MKIKTVFKITQNSRHEFISKVIDSSSPNVEFYFLVIISTLIVTFGLASNNLILVIGGMLVTPLLFPILAISLGVATNENKLLLRSIKVFLFSIILAFIISFIVGFLTKVYIYRIDLITIMKPSWFSFVVAITAGVAASYSWAKPNLDNVLPGTAITVTLIPPLTALGLVLGEQSWFLFFRILEFFVLNIFGIIAGSLLIFLLMDFYKAKTKASKETKLEAKKLAK
ncbi:MAG TPA: TIGR00341 family protein [Patescibacteria group bacterium]|nr:TIGR00341 family protein [Patescibacteria group bacterium]